MTTRVARERDVEPGVVAPATLWAGWLAGPVAWMLHLNASYALVPWVCASGAPVTLLHAVSVGSVLLVAAGTFLAWRAWSRSIAAPANSRTGRGRTRFMAVAGLLSAAYFAVVVIAQAIPSFLVDPCL